MSDQSPPSSDLPETSEQPNTTPPAEPVSELKPIILPSMLNATQELSNKIKSGARPTRQAAGIPLWLPLLALIIAFIFAAYIAVTISGTLASLISPPQPVLPQDAVLQSQGSDSIGDWWLYKSATNGCAVAKVYEDALGTCIYNPSSGCGSGGALAVPGLNQIAECSGGKTTGAYHVMWRVYLTASFDLSNPNQTVTLFRIYRDIG